MAEHQDNIGAISKAGIPEMSYNREIIKDMVFEYPSDTGNEYYPYPTSVSLEELETVSYADAECADFLDTSRPPSSVIYGVGPFQQAQSPAIDGKPERKEAHDPLLKKRSKCDNCGTSFARKSDLRRHAIAQHSPQFTYKCTFKGCNKAFHRKDKFQDHVRRVHECEARSSVEDIVQKAVHQYLHGTQSLDLIPEGCVSKGTTNDQSFWTSLDVQMRQFIDKDTTPSTTATECSYQPSEDFNTALNESCRKGNMLTLSTSSNRNISSKGPEIHPVNLAGRIDPAKLGLGCPYRKHNPVHYNIHGHRTCAISSWDCVARIKEHLIRHHRAPFQCQRCWTCFPTEVDLSVHLGSANLCELRQRSPAEGMTPDVEKRIRSRKRREQSEAKKWEEVYTILFPEEQEIPSPYFVPIGDDAATARDIFSPLPPHLSFFDSKTKVPLISPSPPTSESSTYWTTPPNTFTLREEFSQLFRSRLEGVHARHDTLALDAKWKSQIFDIVAECWDEMLFAQSGSHPTRGRHCEGTEEISSTPPTGYTFLPASESLANNSQSNSDADMASYCMDTDMNSLF